MQCRTVETGEVTEEEEGLGGLRGFRGAEILSLGETITLRSFGHLTSEASHWLVGLLQHSNHP